MRDRISGIVCAALCVTIVLCASRALAAPTTKPAIDEKQVATLVDDLASDDFSVREAATKKLQEMGPDVIAVLEPYKESDNAEIRGRVAGIVRSFEWMKQGALIFQVWPGQLGEKLGFRVGDVVGKINDTPIQHHEDIRTVSDPIEGSATYYVRRENKIIPIVVPKERLSIWSVSWSVDHGGIAQARAFREMSAAKPDFERALADMTAAKNAGASDPFTMLYLSALAAWGMKPEFAAECYELSRPGEYHYCERTHDPPFGALSHLPFDGPHMQWFLKQYQHQPYEPMFAHEVEDWCAVKGRNSPMLRELLGKTQPGFWTSQPTSYAFYHQIAAMRIAFVDRRDEEVLASPLRGKNYVGFDFEDESSMMLMQSALRLGKTADAGDVIFKQRPHPSIGRLKDHEMWAFAGACAADDRETIDKFLRRYKQMEAKDVDALFRSWGGVALTHPAVMPVLRRWWDTSDKKNRRTPLAIVAFAAIASDPSTTAEEFAAAIPPKPQKEMPHNEGLYIATGLVRFGKYAEATALLKGGKKDAFGRFALDIIKDDAEFAAKHKDELSGKWKDLAGFIQVTKSKDNVIWVMRFDGAVFRIDADGTLNAMPKLPPSPSLLTVGFANLVPRDKGVIVVLPQPRKEAGSSDLMVSDVVVLSDLSQTKWLPLSEWDGKYDFTADHYGLNRSIVLSIVDRDHPLPGGEHHFFEDVFSPMFVCDGDIVYARNSKTRQMFDLSAEIAKLAGRKEAARVYAPGGADGEWRLIFSDCGLWTFNQETFELRRIKLGLPDENVMTVQLPADKYAAKKPGYQMVGVAPQQGGEMFLVSPKTGEIEKVKGFCGLGPRDYYAQELNRRFVDHMAPVIHSIYLQRLAKAEGGK